MTEEEMRRQLDLHGFVPWTLTIADAMESGFNWDKDTVNHPKHYTKHPSGVECIQITEHMNFCLGNAIKYIWRADLKNDSIEDLKKAIWYINREIERRKE
jgi:hypothetical protein